MAFFSSAKLNTVPIKNKRIIKEVIEEYRKRNFPNRVLINHFRHNLNIDRETAFNPWLVWRKKEQNIDVEAGQTLDETLFMFSIPKLSKELPTDVIDSVFYSNNVRNDYAFELCYVMPLVKELAENKKKMLVVNPSPKMILEIESWDTHAERVYAVTDEDIACLYGIQFPDSTFIPFVELEDVIGADFILITNRDQADENSYTILSALKNASEEAVCLALLPAKWFNQRHGAQYNQLSDYGFNFEEVLIADPKATDSTPKKKILALLTKEKKKTFNLYLSSYDKGDFEVGGSVKVDTERFFGTNKTILAQFKESSKPVSRKKQYLKAVEYPFSQEITVHYREYSEEDVIRLLVDFRPYDMEEKTFGKPIASTEKRVKSVNRGDLNTEIDNLLISEKLYDAIRDNLRLNYIETGIDITLKTMWFYLIPVLEIERKYNPSFWINTMLHNRGPLANLSARDVSGNDILRLVAEETETDVDELTYTVVEQLHLLYAVAKKHGIIKVNPISEYLPLYSNRATARQQEVRNALVKKHFTKMEEERVFAHAIRKENIKDESYPLCILNSIWLSVPIRLFTGLSIREVGGLMWDDFREIDNGDMYQLYVTKTVDENGKVISRITQEFTDRLRIVPVAPVLAELLNMRKEFLQKNGINESDIGGYPIVMESERIASMKAGRKIPHCKPSKISSVCNEAISVADIPKNEIILPDDKGDMKTDLSKNAGDIFLSNFRDKTNHVASMTLGEISYITGVKAPDTFSAHYCDYSNDLAQVVMIKKINRWTFSYDVEPKKYTINQKGEENGEVNIMAGPFKQGLTSIELIIENRSKEDAVVDIESDNKVTIQKTEYKNVK